MGKVEPKNWIVGRWLIESMELWGRDFIDEEVRGYFEFGAKGSGGFQFGYVQGRIDYRLGERDGKPSVEFTWDGHDEMEAAQGRGWMVLDGDELTGRLFFHLGDDSGIVLKRAPEKRTKPRKRKWRTMPDEVNKLKLGKGSGFVKRDLRRLPQTGDVWEAGFLPLPRKRGRSQEWLGVVVSRKSKLPLATRFCETTPTVNDLAVLLSSAMRRPSIEVEERQRPERIYLHDDPHWAELVPHLEQLGIQVSKTERLALCEKEAAELIGSVAGRSPEDYKKAAKHS